MLGDLAEGLPDRIKLERDAFADPPRDARAHAADLPVPAGPAGAALLDYDQKAMPDEVRQRLADLGGFEGALAALLPGYADLARVVRASTSAGLFHRADRRAVRRERWAARLSLRRRRLRHPAVPRDPAEARVACRLRLDHGRRSRCAPGPQHRRHQRGLARAAGVRRAAAGRRSLAQDHAARQPQASRRRAARHACRLPAADGRAGTSLRRSGREGQAGRQAGGRSRVEKAAAKIAQERGIDIEAARAVVPSSLNGELCLARHAPVR